MAEPTTAEVPEEGAEESGTVTVPTFDKAAIEEFYQGSLSTSEAVDFIASKLNFTEYTTNVKESIQAEIYEQMLNYSKTCGFSVDQTEGFIGLFTSIITSMKGGIRRRTPRLWQRPPSRKCAKAFRTSTRPL